MKKHNRIIGFFITLMLCGCQRAHVQGGPALSAEDFSRQTEQGVVLVDFWATWCGPCKMMNPIIDAAEKKYEGRLKIVRVDVDANQDLAQKFQVQAIPTYVLFRDGKVLETRVGGVGEDNFYHWLETELESP